MTDWTTMPVRDFNTDAPDQQLALIATPDPTGTADLFEEEEAHAG